MPDPMLCSVVFHLSTEVEGGARNSSLNLQLWSQGRANIPRASDQLASSETTTSYDSPV